MQHVETFCYRVAKRVKYVARHNVLRQEFGQITSFTLLLWCCVILRNIFFLWNRAHAGAIPV